MKAEPTAPEPKVLNRELSWLLFNARVLEEARDERNPLLERLRFLVIFHTNLDEFFMVRVSGLKAQLQAAVGALSSDGLSPRAQLRLIREALEPVLVQAQQALHDEILPALERHGLTVVHYADLTAGERAACDAWYANQVHPVLTPLAVGPTHPFPFISNQSLNLALTVRSPEGEQRLARVKVPAVLPRLVPVDDPSRDLAAPARVLPLEELVAANLHTLFPGMEVGRPWQFRIVRDADVEITEDEADDLLKAIAEEVRKRRFGEAVRLEVEAGMPASIRRELLHGLHLGDEDVYEVQGFLAVPRLAPIVDLDLPHLRFAPFVPRNRQPVAAGELFDAIRARDLLVHHPYESFGTVVDFLRGAARDPQVLAIKQTLYRTSGDSPVIRALEEAIENGKQVAAVVELKARFDEENNIVWARRLEQAGVHVVYGVTGLKVHSKLALVVRREGNLLRRYAHVGTGNYNPNTARVYTDLGLFTADAAITADVADVFNRLTGFARPLQYRKLLVAPRQMREGMLELLAYEVEEAKAGRPSGVIWKCNAITDRDVVDALYAASRAGVPIELLVRGICAVVPGQPGHSETIRVRSVVGRFLEHSRVYWFRHGGEGRTYIGSADMMERNLRRRIETLVPIEDPGHRVWLKDVLLQRYLDDTERSRELLSDGRYVRLASVVEGLDVQRAFLEDR